MAPARSTLINPSPPSIPLRSRSRSHSRSAFVLVEVLLALSILGMAAMAFMKSFTYSLNAARKMEIVTQAQFFAAQILDEYEIFPPGDGTEEGDFGEGFANYKYTAEIEYDEPSYREADPPDDVDRFFAGRTIHLVIVYDDGVHTPFKAIELDSAIVGFEKFSSQSKMSYSNY